ncbi:antitermination protein Q [Serratia fonticola]|uniref:antitermination protein Q n=1 Tax=Serratia fonticola TaxID=47917 RepID=UPI0034C5C3FD
MNLEGIAKYFSPKSTLIGSGGSAATAGDSLTITDIMAMIGMASARAEFGITLYLAKVGVQSDALAISLIHQHARQSSHHCRAIQSLEERDRRCVLQRLAEIAYQDYARSAISKEDCTKCGATGFIEERKFIMNRLAIMHDDTHPEQRRQLPEGLMPTHVIGDYRPEMAVKHEYYDVTKKVCPHCNGKRVVSMACSDCKGRCYAIDKNKTKVQGVPVIGECKRCGGRGYSRLSANFVRNEISETIGKVIPETTWRRAYQYFYEKLVQECEIQESYADGVLKRIVN